MRIRYSIILLILLFPSMCSSKTIIYNPHYRPITNFYVGLFNVGSGGYIASDNHIWVGVSNIGIEVFPFSTKWSVGVSYFTESVPYEIDGQENIPSPPPFPNQSIGAGFQNLELRAKDISSYVMDIKYYPFRDLNSDFATFRPYLQVGGGMINLLQYLSADNGNLPISNPNQSVVANEKDNYGIDFGLGMDIYPLQRNLGLRIQVNALNAIASNTDFGYAEQPKYNNLYLFAKLGIIWSPSFLLKRGSAKSPRNFICSTWEKDLLFSSKGKLTKQVSSQISKRQLCAYIDGKDEEGFDSRKLNLYGIKNIKFISDDIVRLHYDLKKPIFFVTQDTLGVGYSLFYDPYFEWEETECIEPEVLQIANQYFKNFAASYQKPNFSTEGRYFSFEEIKGAQPISFGKVGEFSFQEEIGSLPDKEKSSTFGILQNANLEKNAVMMDWMHDGDNLFLGYVKNGDLCICRFDENKQVFIDHKVIYEGQNIFNPVWSSVERKVAFNYDEDLYIVEFDDDFKVIEPITKVSEKEPKSISSEIFYNPQWAPNGTAVAFQAKRKSDNEDEYYYLKIYSLEKNRVIEIEKLNQESDMSPSWSPDNRHLAYIKQIPNKIAGKHVPSSLYVTDLSNANNMTKWCVSDDQSQVSPSVKPVWYPNGKWIFFVNVEQRGDYVYRARVFGNRDVVKMDIKCEKEFSDPISATSHRDLTIYPKSLDNKSLNENVLLMYTGVIEKERIYQVELTGLTEKSDYQFIENSLYTTQPIGSEENHKIYTVIENEKNELVMNISLDLSTTNIFSFDAFDPEVIDYKNDISTPIYQLSAFCEDLIRIGNRDLTYNETERILASYKDLEKLLNFRNLKSRNNVEYIYSNILKSLYNSKYYIESLLFINRAELIDQYYTTAKFKSLMDEIIGKLLIDKTFFDWRTSETFFRSDIGEDLNKLFEGKQNVSEEATEVFNEFKEVKEKWEFFQL